MSYEAIFRGTIPDDGTGDSEWVFTKKINDGFAELYAWIARTDNPQGVTAAQVGAYSKAESDDQVQAAILAASAGIIFGTDAPTSAVGKAGNVYIQETPAGLVFWGPRTLDGWPDTGTPITGLVIGIGAPGTSFGADGQAYIDGQTLYFYVRLSGAWSAPVPLQPWLFLGGPPTNDVGIDGQFAFDAVHSVTYGPKASGAWPAGVPLVGPAPLQPVQPWATATAYVVGPPASFVNQGGNAYACLIPHTSGTFATDLAAGKWGLVVSKGADGSGTGTVVTSGPITPGHRAVFVDGVTIGDGGPATSGAIAAGHVAVFADTSGNLLTDGGAPLTAAAALTALRGKLVGLSLGDGIGF